MVLTTVSKASVHGCFGHVLGQAIVIGWACDRRGSSPHGSQEAESRGRTGVQVPPSKAGPQWSSSNEAPPPRVSRASLESRYPTHEPVGRFHVQTTVLWGAHRRRRLPHTRFIFHLVTIMDEQLQVVVRKDVIINRTDGGFTLDSRVVQE